MHALCLGSELMMGPFDWGALVRQPRKLHTPSILCHSVSWFLLKLILVMSSLSTMRSMMTPAASKLSSHTLQLTNTCSPPMKISLVYSSIAFFESPALGTYFITTVWSGWSLGLRGSQSRELSSRSLMHYDFEASFDLNCFSEAKFLPSLLPRWLQETQDLGLMPALVRKSMKEVLNLVCPVLKSLPMRMPSLIWASLRPFTKFWGEPLMKTQPSWMAATAKIAEGATSSWLFQMELSKFSNVSLTPSIYYEKRSVLAVQRMTTVLRLWACLNLEMSFLMAARWADLSFPSMRLLARSSWLLAMKSLQQMDFMGEYWLMKGSSLACSSQSNTCALLMADARFSELMSQPSMTRSSGRTSGMTSLMRMQSSPSSESATFMVEHWVMEPYMLAFWTPFFVFHSIFQRLAMIPPKMVEPLFPPSPTMSRPTFPMSLSVLKWYCVFQILTVVVGVPWVTEVVLWLYWEKMKFQWWSTDSLSTMRLMRQILIFYQQDQQLHFSQKIRHMSTYKLKIRNIVKWRRECSDNAIKFFALLHDLFVHLGILARLVFSLSSFSQLFHFLSCSWFVLCFLQVLGN